ncbi:hypothetical protein C365_05469 [Cryptococcus neoformans Bt85]|nr:hypothetical protein C365_05469 [Cryptococcus neoformans var. grubii Bt85]
MPPRDPRQPPGAFPEDSESEEDSVQVSISEADSETGPVDPSMSRLPRLPRSYHFSRSYPTEALSIKGNYNYDDGTDGDDEDSELESVMRGIPITHESCSPRTSYNLRTSGGKNSCVTFETILGDGSSAFGTEKPNVMRKPPPDSKTTSLGPYTRYTRTHPRRNVTPYLPHMNGANSDYQEEFVQSAADEAFRYDPADTTQRSRISRMFHRRSRISVSSFGAEGSGTEMDPLVQSDVENNDNEDPTLPPPRDQDPYPVRSTMTETGGLSTTRQSVFRSWLNKLTSFLSGNTPAPTTTHSPQTVAQVLPDSITTTTTAPVRKPIWEILKGENVNLKERGQQSFIQTMGSQQPSLQNSFGGIDRPTFPQIQPTWWDTTHPFQSSQSNQPTMEDLIKLRMMAQMRQSDRDTRTNDGLGFSPGMGYVPSSIFTHSSDASSELRRSSRIARLSDGRNVFVNDPLDTSAVSTMAPQIVQLSDGRRVRLDNSTRPSQANTEGPRIAQLPNGQRIVINGGNGDGGGPSVFGQFTQSTRAQPTNFHVRRNSAAYQYFPAN